MWIRVCRHKTAGVAGYAETFMPVQSDSQTSEWYSYVSSDISVLHTLLAQEGLTDDDFAKMNK